MAWLAYEVILGASAFATLTLAGLVWAGPDLARRSAGKATRAFLRRRERQATMINDWARGRADGDLSDLDFSRPSPARIYDVFLGGKDNFEVDRQAAQIAIDAGPDLPQTARENRQFLGRAVRFLIESGIRQFIDIGTGLPTQGHVHEIAQALAPEAHVVYVDNDPIVASHARALLAHTDNTAVIGADMRQPDSILEHPSVRRLIDFSEPVGMLMFLVLHFASDAEAARILTAFKDVMVPGSYLVISHATADGYEDEELVNRVRSAWDETESKMHPRHRADVEEMFSGFELLEPGLVWGAQWRNNDPLAASLASRWFWAGVGYKHA